MGILDQFKSALGGSKSSASTNANELLQQVMALINSPAIGGVTGLVSKLKSQGLGDVVSSWIGTGANKGISSQQVLQLLGNDQVKQLAGKLGISADSVTQQVSKLLPQVVDKLTPNGSLPDSATLAKGMDLLKKTFFN